MSKGNLVTLVLLISVTILAVIMLGAVLRERNVALNHALLTNALLLALVVEMVAGFFVLWRVDCSLRRLNILLVKYLSILIDGDVEDLLPSFKGVFKWLAASVREEAVLMGELARPGFGSSPFRSNQGSVAGSEDFLDRSRSRDPFAEQDPPYSDESA